MGPFGSGKSSGCAVEIVKRSMEQTPSPDGIRRTKWAIIRNSYRQLEDTSLRTFCQWFPINLFGDFKQSDMRYTIKALPGVEIEILFRALDRPDQVDNLLSLELTGAWVNEAREVPWTIIQALMGRVGRYPQGNLGSWYGVIMDTNPPDNDSWWYRQFEEKRPAGWELFKQPSGLSPEAENLRHLPKNYYTNLIGSMEPELAKVYIHGDYGFVIDGKPVYHEYRDTLHCAEVDVIPGQVIYRGWDFGLTPACVLAQFVNGRLTIFGEIVSDSMGADTFSDEVLAYCNTHYPNYSFKDIGDPAGNTRSQADEKTCFQILWSKGINIEPGEQTLAARIESVKKPLNTLVDGKPCLQMSPKCKTLRKGFQGGYMFKRVRVSEERYKDEPFKNAYSHCFTGETLVSCEHGDKRIDQVMIGDRVKTPSGYRTVVATMNSLSSNLLDIALSNGKSLTCTRDHPFYTPDGIVLADALQYNSVLIGIEENKWAGHRSIKYKNLTGSGFIQNLAATSRQIIKSTAGYICTAMYGKSPLGRFQLDSRCTIKTMINQTTGLKTSNLLLAGNMLHITEDGVSCSILMPQESTCSPMSFRQQERGIARKRGLSGTQYMEGKRGLTASQRNSTVSSAEKNTKACCRRKGIAHRLASLLRGAPQALMTLLSNAVSAKNNSARTNTQKQKPVLTVVRVSPHPEQRRVYDLTVDDAHCFYANGALVSNCHDALQYVCTRLFFQHLITQENPIVTDRYKKSPVRNYSAWAL